MTGQLVKTRRDVVICVVHDGDNVLSTCVGEWRSSAVEAEDEQ